MLLISHGSHSPKTKLEVQLLVEALRKRKAAPIIEFAFLEIEEPDISMGIDLCIKQGATAVIILLNFLNSGKHVDEDIPRIIQDAQKRYPNISLMISKPVGQHPKIDELFIDLISTNS